MAKKTKSKKRTDARRKRNQRGLGLRSNRSAQDTLAAAESGESEAASMPAVPPVDAPARRSLLERVPPVARWTLMVTFAIVVGVMIGMSHTVKLGVTGAIATFLAGSAFLVSYLPPSLRSRPGDGAAIGFGRATGHDRPDPDADEDGTLANRAARRRARREGAE
jgi:hypothetical protein